MHIKHSIKNCYQNINFTYVYAISKGWIVLHSKITKFCLENIQKFLLQGFRSDKVFDL